jgi:hypothetical protein
VYRLTNTGQFLSSLGLSTDKRTGYRVLLKEPYLEYCLREWEIQPCEVGLCNIILILMFLTCGGALHTAHLRIILGHTLIYISEPDAMYDLPVPGDLKSGIPADVLTPDNAHEKTAI